MNKLLAALTALTALAAAPASAQYLDRTDAAIDGRISKLQTELRTGIEAHTITAGEAQPLRAKLRELTLVERRYRQSEGFDRREKADLEQRLHTLDTEIALADGGRRRPDGHAGLYSAAGR